MSRIQGNPIGIKFIHQDTYALRKEIQKDEFSVDDDHENKSESQ